VASAPPPPPRASVPLAARDEEYGSTKETGFASVRTKPLSTFSIDVDTASYSNLRRFILQQGQLPPKEAVRIEELLNFFDYEYPIPVGPHPFSVTAEIGNCPWNRAHQLVHIGLKSSPVSTKDLPPSNLVFLIDVSGSMMPENKLPLIKKSFRLLVEQLRSQDKVSIVVYAGAAGLVLPPTSGSHKQVILDAIERLQAGGSTAGAQGIQLAYATARRNFNKSGNNRVILATDGDFNVGISSDAELVKLIEAERQAGIFLTVLGYGYGNLKDAKLEGLARNGNGNYAYIDTVLEARRVLVEQMGATLLTVAKDVKMQVEFNPARIKAYRLIGYENRRLNDEDFKDDAKDAGELGAGHSVTAVYEVVPADSPENVGLEVDPLKYQSNQVVASAAGSSEALTVKLRYKQPNRDSSIEFAQPVEHRVVAAPSRNFRLTMAVCELGLLLSDSSFKKDASFKSAIANAQSAIGDDASGMRSEFVYIANTAAKLASINARK
jgi:Ca-activated chloride channel family protein